MTARLRRPCAILLLVLIEFTAGFAQTTTTPSAHFGALLFPRDRPGYEAGVHLNRFTEFDKKTALVDGIEQPIRFNQIDKTFGFNLLAFAVTNRLEGSDNFLYRLTFQTGVTSDEPTEFLQNEVVHDLRGIPHVPVGETATEFDVDVSAEISRWYRGRAQGAAFIGAGVSLGTINQDAFGQGGYESPAIRIGRFKLARLSGLVRAGFPAGGLSFKASDLANGYAMAQGSVTFPVAAGLTRGILPTVGWGITQSTGFFADESGNPIDELFWTIQFSWSDRVAIETWNDSLGGKDRGPTFGVRITTAWRSSPGLDHLFRMDSSD